MNYDNLKLQYQKVEQSVIYLKEYLYNNPEIGGEEDKSIRMLIKTLKEYDFEVCENYADVKNAFRAVYKGDKPGAVIAFIAEPDALPNIGHGCGHNLISATSVAAAICARDSVDIYGGEISLICTPGEENLCTKIDILENGGFSDIDIALMIHPFNRNLSSGKTLAIESIEIDFKGKTAHAGLEPEKGINALDAAVLCYNMIAMQKQYLIGSNIHGIISDGGEKASVIPDKSSLKYLCRAKSFKELKNIRTVLERCAEASAKAVGCTVNIWNNEPTNKDMQTNNALSNIFNKHIKAVGGIEMQNEDTNGSTDMGDLSYAVPAIHPWIAITNTDTALHTERFGELTLLDEANIAMKNAAISLAATAFEIFENPEKLSLIKEEFNRANR